VEPGHPARQPGSPHADTAKTSPTRSNPRPPHPLTDRPERSGIGSSSQFLRVLDDVAVRVGDVQRPLVCRIHRRAWQTREPSPRSIEAWHQDLDAIASWIVDDDAPAASCARVSTTIIVFTPRTQPAHASASQRRHVARCCACVQSVRRRASRPLHPFEKAQLCCPRTHFADRPSARSSIALTSQRAHSASIALTRRPYSRAARP
jgi:hypothetical protein